MRTILATTGLAWIAAGAAIATAINRNGADFAALASMTCIAAGCVLFLASRAFKGRRNA